MLATVKGHYNGSRIVLDLPIHFRQGQEVVVTYTPFYDEQKPIQSSIVDSLIGIIPDQGKSLDDYRKERLKKYEAVD